MPTPRIIHLAPYEYEPCVAGSDAEALLAFFSQQFTTIYGRKLGPVDIVMIFHDWWFAPYGRDMMINAETMYELAVYVAHKLHTKHTLPRYFVQAHNYVQNSDFAFHGYTVKCSLFNGAYSLKKAAA